MSSSQCNCSGPSACTSWGGGSFLARRIQALPRPRKLTPSRWVQKNRNMLFDHEGRHRFRESSKTPAYLLAFLVKPFRVDQPLAQSLADIAADSALARWYRD